MRYNNNADSLSAGELRGTKHVFLIAILPMDSGMEVGTAGGSDSRVRPDVASCNGRNSNRRILYWFLVL